MIEVKRSGKERAKGWALVIGAWAAVVFWPFARQAIDRWERPAPGLAAGMLLVAAPGGTAAPFERAVVLVTESAEGGASGVVVNGPVVEVATSTLMGTFALPSTGTSPLSDHRDPAEPGGGAFRDGGPVGRDTETLLWRKEGGAIAWTRRAGLSAGPLGTRAIVGRAEWAAGQLDRELAHGAWIVADARGVDVLSAPVASLWADLVARGLRRLETVR